MKFLLLVGCVCLATSTLSAEELFQPASVAAYEHLPLDSDDASKAPTTDTVSLTQAIVDTEQWAPSPSGLSCVNHSHSTDARTCGNGVDGSPSFWFGAVELTMLHTSYGSPLMSTDDFGVQVGPRYVLGWEHSSGLGFRSRFWDYYVETEVIPSFPPFTLDLRASRFDFDVYRRFSFTKGSIAVGGSASAALLEFERDEIGPIFNNPLALNRDYAFRNSGGGVGLFVEGRHRLYHSARHEWNFFSYGRWTTMVGEWSHTGFGRQVGNNALKVTEAALGIEYQRKFTNADLVLQCSFEGQQWDVTGVPNFYYVYPYGPSNSNVTFLGPSVSIGFTR